jgi:hypothetical protein
MPAANTTATDRKPSPRTPYAVRTPTARAKLTNGTRGMVLPGIDQRSAIARRYRDVICAIIADLGGENRLSEARLQLIRRFSALVVQAETMEAALVDGKPSTAARTPHFIHSCACGTCRPQPCAQERDAIPARLSREQRLAAT